MTRLVIIIAIRDVNSQKERCTLKLHLVGARKDETQKIKHYFYLFTEASDYLKFLNDLLIRPGKIKIK